MRGKFGGEWIHVCVVAQSLCCSPITTLLTGYACVHAKLLQSCLNFCGPMIFCDCSLPGSSVCGILQARLLEWVVMPSSRESSWPRDQTCISYVSFISRQVLYHQSYLGNLLFCYIPIQKKEFKEKKVSSRIMERLSWVKKAGSYQKRGKFVSKRKLRVLYPCQMKRVGCVNKSCKVLIWRVSISISLPFYPFSIKAGEVRAVIKTSFIFSETSWRLNFGICIRRLQIESRLPIE